MNNQLVPYNNDAAKNTLVHDVDDLDTYGSLFKYYKSFHRLSGDQDRDARTSAYHELINLMLSQTSEEEQLINVTAARPKADGLSAARSFPPRTFPHPETLGAS